MLNSTDIHLKVTDTKCPYIKISNVVLQQNLDVANTLLGTDKGEWDHSLCQ